MMSSAKVKHLTSAGLFALILLQATGLIYGQVEWSIRLRGGATPLQGRVEVYVDGEWGTVRTDDEWDINDATVVCRQLGFLIAQSATHGDHFNPAKRTMAVHIGHVQCSGDESSLSECHYRKIYRQHVRQHSLDAGVVCAAEHSLRLINGTSHNQGELEIFHHDSQWKSICFDDNWEIEQAVVACRQLGYQQLVEYRGVVDLQNNSSMFVSLTSNCTGSEFHLQTCPEYTPTSETCSSQQTVFLHCAAAPLAPHSPLIDNTTCNSLQLSWERPNYQGHPIINYTLRYRPLNHTHQLQNWNHVHINSSSLEGERVEVTLEHLLFGTHYQLEVKVTNEIGSSGFSESGIGVTSQPSAILFPPDNLRAGHVSVDNVTLSWNAQTIGAPCVAIPTSYELMYQPLNPAHLDTVVQLSIRADYNITSTGVTHTVTSLRPFTRYSVQVRVLGYVNGDENQLIISPWSEPVTFMTLESVPSAPPQTFTAYLSHLQTSAHFQWSPAPSSDLHGILTGYSLLCRKFKDGGEEEPLRETLGSNVLQYELQTLDNRTEYNCSIAATTQAGEGPRSAPVYFATPGDLNQRPSPPRNVAFAIQSSNDDNNRARYQLQASWKAHDCESEFGCIEALGYIISCEYERIRGQKEEIRMVAWQADIVNGAIFPFAVATLQAKPFTSYSCRMASMNVYGVGIYGSRLHVEKVDAIPLQSPINLYATQVQTDSVLIHWTYNEYPHVEHIVGFLIDVYEQDSRYPERNGPLVFNDDLYELSMESGSTVSTVEYSRSVTYLSTGKNYNVFVSALTNAGEGPKARMIVSTLRTAPQYAPTSLTNTIVNDNTEPFQFEFSWRLSQSFTSPLTHAGFILHCYDNSSESSSDSDILTHPLFANDNQLSYSVVVSLPSNCESSVRSYLCSVTAFNERGEGPRSEETFLYLPCALSQDIFAGTFLTHPYYSLAFLSTLILLIITVVFSIIILCICNKCLWNIDKHKSETKNPYSSVYDDSYVRMAPSHATPKSLWSRAVAPRTGISLPIAGESSDDPYNHYDEIPGDRTSRTENVYDEIHPRTCTTMFNREGTDSCAEIVIQAAVEHQSILTLELSKQNSRSSNSDFEESQLTTTTTLRGYHHHGSNTSETTTETHHCDPCETNETIRPSSASPVPRGSTEYVDMLQTAGLRVTAESSHSSDVPTTNTSEFTLECPQLSVQRQHSEYNPYYNVPELRCQEDNEKKKGSMAEDKTVMDKESLSESENMVDDCNHISVNVDAKSGSCDESKCDDDKQTRRSCCSVDNDRCGCSDQPMDNRGETTNTADSANSE